MYAVYFILYQKKLLSLKASFQSASLWNQLLVIQIQILDYPKCPSIEYLINIKSSNQIPY